MKTRRGSKSSAEISESPLRKRVRFKRADTREDQAETIEDVDEADNRIQEPVDQVTSVSDQEIDSFVEMPVDEVAPVSDQEDGSVEVPVDQVAPGSDQIEECNPDQVSESSNRLLIAVKYCTNFERHFEFMIVDVQILQDAVREARQESLSIRGCCVKYKIGRAKLTKCGTFHDASLYMIQLDDKRY